jgi:hypothetical protein
LWIVTPHSLRRNAPLQLDHATESGDIEVRSDIRQRIQNEVALHYPGMWEGELRIGEALAPINEHIEVDDARAPSLALLRAALRGLDRL